PRPVRPGVLRPLAGGRRPRRLPARRLRRAGQGAGAVLMRGGSGRPVRRGLRGLGALALLALMGGPVTAAEAMPFTADLEVTLLLKILTYDRSFAAKAKSGVTIGVVFVPTDPQSVKAKDEIIKTLQAVSDRTIKNLPIKFQAVEYRGTASLESAARAGVNV